MYKWGRRFHVEAMVYHRIQFEHDKKRLFALLEFWKPDSTQDEDKGKENLLEGLLFSHVRMINHHLFVGFEKPCIQTLSMQVNEIHAQAENGRGHTPQRLSNGLDMTFWLSATRQSKARYRRVFCEWQSEELERPKREKQRDLLCAWIHIDHKLTIYQRVHERIHGIFMMGKVKTVQLTISIVTINLLNITISKKL